MDTATAKTVAEEIAAEYGSWMLSELGDDGLRDAIWATHPPYRRWGQARRREFTDQVYAEIYG